MPNIGGPIGRSWLDASREGMLLLSRVFIPSRITILPGVPPNELNLDESINGFDVRGAHVFPGYTLSSLAFRETARVIFPTSFPPPRVPSLRFLFSFFERQFLRSRFRSVFNSIFNSKKRKEKKEERKKKEKCARYPTPTLGSKKLIGYAIFDRRAGYGRGRGGKGPPLLTRVVNGVASACVTIGN